eukprot:m.892165 g.892165  ORF g.892165 m.892165 type:complete len:198 (-) comp59971_c0_seq9:4221-4814(-)
MHWLVWWLAAASVAGVAWGALLVNIGPDAHCTVSIDGLQFLSTADICTFTSNSSACAAEGSLRLQNFSSTAGADVFGSFNKTSFVWIANGDTVFITAFRVYEDVSAVVFEQQWPNGAVGTQSVTPQSGGMNAVSSTFPSFNTKATAADEPLGFLAYNGDMVGWSAFTGLTSVYILLAWIFSMSSLALLSTVFFFSFL